MSATQFYFYAGLLFAALGLSAMFAGIETGIYSLNRIRLAIEVGRARKAAMISRSWRMGGSFLEGGLGMGISREVVSEQ